MTELLAPAGDFVKLKTAIQYGADAVYMGNGAFSLRSASENFEGEDMERGIEYAHRFNKKVYVTANIIPKNDDLEDIARYAEQVYAYGADAIIVSDLGAFQACRDAAPKLPIHVSTQANNNNYGTCNMWYFLGARRIILSRELSFAEIAEVREKTAADLELESFVHGAMCVSYSGRCLLSNYMLNRDANRGDCAQPCRWKYHLVEEKRPDMYIPVFENERGTFIFNSRDLCLIARIPELVSAGVDSLKIEGRVKSEYYLATVVKAYREELDRYMEDPQKYVFDPAQYEELDKVSHRHYSEGFAMGGEPGQIYETSSYIRNYEVVARVIGYEDGVAELEQRNKFSEGDSIEFLQPDKPFFTQENVVLWDGKGAKLESTPHSKMRFFMKVDKPVVPGGFARKRIGEKYT